MRIPFHVYIGIGFIAIGLWFIGEPTLVLLAVHASGDQVDKVAIIAMYGIGFVFGVFGILISRGSNWARMVAAFVIGSGSVLCSLGLSIGASLVEEFEFETIPDYLLVVHTFSLIGILGLLTAGLLLHSLVGDGMKSARVERALTEEMVSRLDDALGNE